MPAGCQKQPDAGFTRPRPSYWTYEFNDKTFAFLAQMWLVHVVHVDRRFAVIEWPLVLYKVFVMFSTTYNLNVTKHI